MSVSHINNTLVYTNPSGQVYFASGDSANCTVSTCPVELSVYGYRPSLAASGTLTGLYAICLIIQVVIGWRYKTWWYMGAMVLGCIDEILGYVGRILYWQNPWAKGGFIMQIVLITIGPVFFSAAIYVELTLLVNHFGRQFSRFNPKWYYWVFIPCDIVSLALQAAGGAMSSSSNGRSETGVNIALAGLAFQVATLTIFALLCIDFGIRSRSVWHSTKLSIRIKIFCIALALATLLILIRCAYRIYELSDGYVRTSAALRDEGMFIGLESVMVVVAAYCLLLSNPGWAFESAPSLTFDHSGSPEK